MSQLDRYEILEQMGTGAMGNVYRARDTALERTVALKTIHTGIDVAPEIRQRFYQEARACARLQHPNIITVFDLGEAENTAYIAMELLQGADFRRIIQERRAIPLDEKIAAMIDVFDAIGHAHSHGVIHRDIKPSNLFLTDNGRAKVLDFGIARLPSSNLTVAGQILGTPNYMAPEQILARPCDGRADLFSAAVVFFEFLTYAHPFQSKFIPQRIVQSEPDSLFDGGGYFPVILEKLLARGLAKDPDQRYQTADEFAADLRAVLDGLRGNASPGFSSFQLPSQHAKLSTKLEPESARTVEAPEGQDSQEWRLSEALRLLPEFEAAIDHWDLAKARAAATDLESRLAGDVRFNEAIRLCRSRLGGLEVGAASMSCPSSPPPQSVPSMAWEDLERIPPDQLPPTEASAIGSIDIDATFFGASATTKAGLPIEPLPQCVSEPAAVAAPASDTRPETLKAPSSKAPRSAKPNPDRRKFVIIGGGTIVCAVLVLVAGVAALRPVPKEPYPAVAAVRVASATVYADSSPGARRIASVPRGTQLNVLRLPTSHDQEWIRVQAVTRTVLRPGYVRAKELVNWHGRTGVAALSLIRALDPGEAGTEAEINSQIEELNAVASGFSGEPAANEAHFDAARLRLSLARRWKLDGRPAEEWQSELKAGLRELELAGGDPSIHTQVLDLNNQIEELLRYQPSTLHPSARDNIAVKLPSPDISARFTRARQLYQDGSYADAERIINEIFKMSPRNKDAQELREKIRRARDAENK